LIAVNQDINIQLYLFAKWRAKQFLEQAVSLKARNFSSPIKTSSSKYVQTYIGKKGTYKVGA